MFTEDVSLSRVKLAQGYNFLKSGVGTEAPPVTDGAAWARLGQEGAGLSAWEDEAPRTRGGSCACEEGFRDEGGGFGVIFVRAIVAAAKEEEKEKWSGVTEADSIMAVR